MGSVLFRKAFQVLPDNHWSDRKTEQEIPIAQVTIAQMVVPLWEVDGIPEPEALTNAFDLGLMRLRMLQRAYYIATRNPISLGARESMPPFVPLALTTPDTAGGFSVEHAMFALNINVDTEARQIAVTNDEIELISRSLEAEEQARAFVAYPQLHREAVIAFDRRGDYRPAVLLAAAAAEVLLDELLACLVWEEARRPEESASIFDQGLITRVKQEYHPRLGGSWDLARETGVGVWNSQLARVRHRIVHAGYEPSRHEASEGIDALGELERFITRRLSDDAGLAKYPKTAIAMMTQEGLKQRRKWTKRIEQLVNDPAEVEWIPTFGRWRAAVVRETQEAGELFTRPSVENSTFVAVAHVDGEIQWFAHDRDAGYVCEIPDSTGLSDEVRAALFDFRDWYRENNPGESAAIGIVGGRFDAGSMGVWIPEYRAIPLLGVMVNGLDLDYQPRNQSRHTS